MDTTFTSKSTRWWRWLAAILAGTVLWFLATATAGGAALAITGANAAEFQGITVVTFAILAAPLTTAGIWLALRLVGLGLPDIGLSVQTWPQDVLLGTAVAVLYAAVQFAIIIPHTGGASRSDVIASRAIIGDSLGGLLAAICLGVVVGGYSEELFFRGHLITTIRRLLGNTRWGVAIAVFVSVGLFARGHAYQGWIGMVDTAVGALIWTSLYLWRGRLTAAMVGHGLWDVLALIGLYLWY